MIYQDKSQIIKPTCPAMLQYHENETKKTYAKKTRLKYSHQAAS